ncbi:universal stress protein [Telmatobacter sp. DSM 110680]|uniref:Universal stress protein n=1 Tax=Telmatobacter sp. DSM 110680 TaxID=3036704 RepID=A0AAU7DFR7_9BACT
MYKKIMIAFDESAEAKHALSIAVELARVLKADLRILTVSEPLPVYAAFMDSELPGARQALLEERNAFYRNLQSEGIKRAEEHEIAVEGIIVEGDEVQAIIDQIAKWGAELLVIGRRHHSGTVSRVWGGTVHNIAERVQCSILAVS